MSAVSKLEFLGCAIAAAFAFGSACAKPCADVRLSPLSQGAMLYGDPVHLVDGKPFAKDPTVIRHGGRYLMYYSVNDGETQLQGLAGSPYGCGYGAGKWTELTMDKPLLAPELPWEGHCIEAKI